MTPEAHTAVLPTSRPTVQAVEVQQVSRRRGRRALILVVLVAIAAAAYAGWRYYFATTVPTNVIPLSGRIEGDVSTIAPKAGGRINEIRVREGDSVNLGDTIAVLDDEQV